MSLRAQKYLAIAVYLIGSFVLMAEMFWILHWPRVVPWIPSTDQLWGLFWLAIAATIMSAVFDKFMDWHICRGE